MINLSVVKSADRSYVFVGASNRIRYSISINNLGDETVNSVKVRDVLSKGVSFVPGSLILNCCRQECVNYNGEFVVGSIEPGSNVIISFEVELQRNYTPKVITNRAVVSYFDNLGNRGSVESNEVVTPVININVCLNKTVDKDIARVGEIISYSVLIRNNSNVDINDVIFYDELPVNLSLLPSSVLVESVPQFVDSFNGGISVGDIKANSGIMVSFQAEVLYVPKPSVIVNVANVNYYYSIYDNEIKVTSIGKATSNCVKTKILPANCNCNC